MAASKFWLVWCPTSDKAPTLRHPTQQSAEEEATRLAKLLPQHEFIVLGSIAMFRATRVERIDLSKEHCRSNHTGDS